ncbi:MAG: hypothetical protein A2X59_03515 [Nitrospirae bacterium GWC2_42_7]|nr:MAG: hypothetical protein A2X59_03515 [Nitrospirae bacterium GWC2_42_7]
MKDRRVEHFDGLLKDIPEFYKVLKLDIQATEEEITKAYKEALYIWDPEQFNGKPEQQEKAFAMTNEIDKAYQNIILYMTHPQYQYHPLKPLKSQFETNYIQDGPEDEYKEETVGKASSFIKQIPRLSFRNIKPFLSLPNIVFVIYAAIIFVLYAVQYEAFSIYFIPHIFKKTIGFLLPPFVFCLLYNLIQGKAKKASAISLLITSLWFFIIFPLRIGIYESIYCNFFDNKVVVSAAETEDMAWVRKGDILMHDGKNRGAIKAYSNAIQLNPSNAEAYYARSIVYSSIGREAEFVSDCRIAARLGNLEAVKTLSRQDLNF